MLPPGIARDRCAPVNAEDVRAEFRHESAIAVDDILLLMVGSGFKTKGVDRAIAALANLPKALRDKTRLFVIGQDNSQAFVKQAQSLAVEEHVEFFSGRDDVPRFLLGADLLLHPARHENTGTVLLEALVAALPVLCSGVCGYAHYIVAADSGKVTAQHYTQLEFDRCLIELLQDKNLRLKCAENALKFAKSADLYSMTEHAVGIIEKEL